MLFPSKDAPSSAWTARTARPSRGTCISPQLNDGEGHVIRYAATVPPGGNSLQFLSDAAPAATRCRMTYTRARVDSVTEKFEIAPPGNPDEFAKYVELRQRGSANRSQETPHGKQILRTHQLTRSLPCLGLGRGPKLRRPANRREASNERPTSQGRGARCLSLDRSLGDSQDAR